MTNATVEVITSVQRRRRWSRAEKERIVAAAIEPDAVASEIARAAGIHTSQLFRWRQQLCGRGPDRSTFSAVTVAPPSEPVAGPRCGMIEIEFAAGGRMRITGAVDPLTVSAAIAALSKLARSR